jgi:hypothetical protein
MIPCWAVMAPSVNILTLNSMPGRAARACDLASCDRLARPDLTFFLCRERDDMAALLASKSQQLWMRPNVGLPAVQFHGPLAQFATGWCKACFRGSSHFLSLDLGSLIATMGSTGFEPTVSSQWHRGYTTANPARPSGCCSRKCRSAMNSSHRPRVPATIRRSPLAPALQPIRRHPQLPRKVFC